MPSDAEGDAFVARATEQGRRQAARRRISLVGATILMVPVALGFLVADAMAGRWPSVVEIGYWALVWTGCWLVFRGWIWEVIDARRRSA